MNGRNAQSGSTLVELIMVMTLLTLFGVTIYTLIQSGSSTQERITREKDAQMNARIAMSYINVRLRQNDAKDKVAVEPIALTGSDAIVIRERNIDYEYDTWIYCKDGMLMECLVNPGEQPTEMESFYVVDADGLETFLDPETGSITNTVYYSYSDSQKHISSTVNMRSY